MWNKSSAGNGWVQWLGRTHEGVSYVEYWVRRIMHRCVVQQRESWRYKYDRRQESPNISIASKSRYQGFTVFTILTLYIGCHRCERNTCPDGDLLSVSE
ncbi:hypothetical protein FIBSPDRAFT_306344 [Athelia psychrophila]|uniref:Uncharacterized protein n=1 Tax=Athelia psychrophila TaxID=1759441 RepID=A0A166W5V5_9AGAM|nr:hypothetical protein FIBSPDRAFT_306344 [Fibularhizoctonia sp. CBS 109695]